jgi:hypothetical protein
MMTFASNWPWPPGPELNVWLPPDRGQWPNSTTKERGYGWED